MREAARAGPLAFLAEHLARKGPEELDKMQSTIDLARQLLASEEIQPYGEGENPFQQPPYSWEISKPPIDGPRRIFLGTVSDLATGLGHTIYFAAGLARDEDEFRRQLARTIGHTLANGAKASPGLEEFPFSRTFISPRLRQTLQKFDEGKSPPANFLYLCQWHENLS